MIKKIYENEIVNLQQQLQKGKGLYSIEKSSKKDSINIFETSTPQGKIQVQIQVIQQKLNELIQKQSLSNQIENINIRADHLHIDILYSEEFYK